MKTLSSSCHRLLCFPILCRTHSVFFGTISRDNTSVEFPIATTSPQARKWAPANKNTQKISMHAHHVWKAFDSDVQALALFINFIHFCNSYISNQNPAFRQCIGKYFSRISMEILNKDKKPEFRCDRTRSLFWASWVRKKLKNLCNENHQEWNVKKSKHSFTDAWTLLIIVVYIIAEQLPHTHLTRCKTFTMNKLQSVVSIVASHKKFNSVFLRISAATAYTMEEESVRGDAALHFSFVEALFKGSGFWMDYVINASSTVRWFWSKFFNRMQENVFFFHPLENGILSSTIEFEATVVVCMIIKINEIDTHTYNESSCFFSHGVKIIILLRGLIRLSMIVL